MTSWLFSFSTRFCFLCIGSTETRQWNLYLQKYLGGWFNKWVRKISKICSAVSVWTIPERYILLVFSLIITIYLPLFLYGDVTSEPAVQQVISPLQLYFVRYSPATFYLSPQAAQTLDTDTMRRTRPVSSVQSPSLPAPVPSEKQYPLWISWYSFPSG